MSIKNGHRLAAMLARRQLGSTYEAKYERDDEENNRHPEKESSSFHCSTGYATEAQKRRNKCNQEENNGPVQ